MGGWLAAVSGRWLEDLSQASCFARSWGWFRGDWGFAANAASCADDSMKTYIGSFVMQNLSLGNIIYSFLKKLEMTIWAVIFLPASSASFPKWVFNSYWILDDIHAGCRTLFSLTCDTSLISFPPCNISRNTAALFLPECNGSSEEKLIYLQSEKKKLFINSLKLRISSNLLNNNSSFLMQWALCSKFTFWTPKHFYWRFSTKYTSP